MSRYIKKPVIIEAFQFDGDLMDSYGNYYIPDWAVASLKSGNIYFSAGNMYIKTRIGVERIEVDDYVIIDAEGALHWCMQDTFNDMYELIGE